MASSTEDTTGPRSGSRIITIIRLWGRILHEGLAVSSQAARRGRARLGGADARSPGRSNLRGTTVMPRRMLLLLAFSLLAAPFGRADEAKKRNVLFLMS